MCIIKISVVKKVSYSRIYIPYTFTGSSSNGLTTGLRKKDGAGFIRILFMGIMT